MQEQEYVVHHVQKILAFFGAMRNFAHQLKKKGHEVIYLELDDKDNVQDFARNIKFLIKKHEFTRFEYQLPDEYRLNEQLRHLAEELNIETATADTEHFLTTRYEVKEFFAGSKTYLMERFYRHMRQKLHLLMDGDDPEGDRWNYDADNRKRYNGKADLPEPLTFNHNVSSLKKMIDDKKVRYFGNVDEQHLEWPLSRQDAIQSLYYFCEKLLPHFGTYEDAMLHNHISLFHSRLSFALNVKMISPAEVIGQVLQQYKQHQAQIDIAQVEGYVRQIVGWREFMRGVYWANMPEYAEKNYLDHHTGLPHWFWNANTNMNCLQKCIGQSLQHAWAHHIQRLMVIGNFALLAGIHPDGVDAWYLGVYIDAIQWVEITNTRGMSQYADGGIVGSKPYVASAAYINKMSDYCKHCHYDYKKKYGERACPYNSLYWDFFDRHANKLHHNPRIGMAYVTLKKMKPDEKEKILLQAAKYLNRLNEL